MTIRLLAFYLINYVLIFFAYIPGQLKFISTYFPAIDLMFLFFFYGFKRENLSFFFVLIISLIHDVISQNILGTTALIYFLIILIFPYQSKIFFFKSFTEIWLAFAIFILQIFFLEGVLNFFTHSRAINFQLLSIELLLSLSLYPIFHLFFQKISETFLSARNANPN